MKSHCAIYNEVWVDECEKQWGFYAYEKTACDTLCTLWVIYLLALMGHGIIYYKCDSVWHDNEIP